MKRLVLTFSLIAFMAPSFSNAAVTLLEKDDWKVLMGGFAELDMFHDSKRSLTEVIGNTPIDRPGADSGNGDHGRTQFSVRNSRLAFTILPPDQDEWKTKGYLEFDLLGYEPSPGATGVSEGAYQSNPTLRVRHAYVNAENNGWSLLAGQYWTLFGWNPTYVLTTASVPPAPAVIYQRTQQLTGMKTLTLGEKSKLQVGVSVSRPSQRDSDMPNLDAGAKYAYSGIGAGFASPTGEVNVEPLSVAVSGTMRKFETFKSRTVADGTNDTTGSALAVDAMIPILPATEKDPGNSITLTGEFTSGKGDADAFPSWSGNLSQTPAGSTGSASRTNIDAGQGGFDSSDNNFRLVQIQTWNAQLQYHFPASWHMFMTVGYGQLSAKDMAGLGPVKATGVFLYDKSEIEFINLFHDCTKQIRVAAEYSKMTTHYVDDVKASDDRYQLSAYFRF